MCPFCVAGTAIVVAKATSASGGVAALFVKLRGKGGNAKSSSATKPKENENGN